MLTKERSARQINLITKLSEGASLLSNLHSGSVHGSIRTWTPVAREDVRVFMLERITKVVIACAQAQQLIMEMDEDDLPKFLLVTKDEVEADDRWDNAWENTY